MIPTKLHAVVDYLFGIVAISAPWLLGFNQLATPTALLVTVGALTLVMSLFTNYEGGVVRIIPMRIHLGLDLLIGIVLSLSPWLFNFSDFVKYPHLAMGIFAIIASLITRKTSIKKSAYR